MVAESLHGSRLVRTNAPANDFYGVQFSPCLDRHFNILFRSRFVPSPFATASIESNFSRRPSSGERGGRQPRVKRLAGLFVLVIPGLHKADENNGSEQAAGRPCQ
jgi:hypothetical protein